MRYHLSVGIFHPHAKFPSGSSGNFAPTCSPPGDVVFPGGYNIPGSSAFPGDIVFYLYVHHCVRLMAGFDIGLMESHTQAVWVRG